VLGVPGLTGIPPTELRAALRPSSPKQVSAGGAPTRCPMPRARRPRTGCQRARSSWTGTTRRVGIPVNVRFPLSARADLNSSPVDACTIPYCDREVTARPVLKGRPTPLCEEHAATHLMLSEAWVASLVKLRAEHPRRVPYLTVVK
jgi:hypothetical protein